MSRPLTTIMLMGMAAAVLMAVAGSMFVGQVGGAEDVQGLREDIQGLYGRQMEDPDSLSITVRKWEGRTGLIVEYAPVSSLARRPTYLAKHFGRISSYILGRERWKTRVEYVFLRGDLGNGQFLEKRFLRTPRPTPSR